jgi:hypothetical protein
MGPDPEIVLPFWFVEMLDGIAKCGSRHSGSMGVEEVTQLIPVHFLAGLT